jgi:SapC protein
MTRLVPVREIPHLQLALPDHDRWIGDLNWVPVSATEIHLACRYYPIAVRFEEQRPQLGLIVDQRYLAAPLLDSAGTWRGAYRPVGLRCFPFQAPHIGDNPLSDIVIDAASEYLSTSAGIPIVDGNGRPARLLIELHRLFCLLKRSRDSFASVLDQFLIGGLLVPLTDPGKSPASDEEPLYVLDPVRLSQMTNTSLGAMARDDLLSVDVAVACAFSLQNLRPEYRPTDAARRHQPPLASVSIAPDLAAIDDLSLALDDGELVLLWNIDGLRAEIRPATA